MFPPDYFLPPTVSRTAIFLTGLVTQTSPMYNATALHDP